MKNLESTSLNFDEFMVQPLNVSEMASTIGGSWGDVKSAVIGWVVEHVIDATIDAVKHAQATGYQQSSGSKLMHTALH